VSRPDGTTRWAAAVTVTVLVAALAGVAAVWVLSAWWSFAEQTRAADHLRFTHPSVLPWTLDGLACALALVALAAALDGRPATAARLGVALALAGSVWSNRLGVQLRYPARQTPADAVRLAAVAPLAAAVAFEVLLAALRRLVLRWRGLPAPAPIPTLRPVRLLLDPKAAFIEWRRAVLKVTAPLIPGTPVRHSAGVPDTTTAPAPTPDRTDAGLDIAPDIDLDIDLDIGLDMPSTAVSGDLDIAPGHAVVHGPGHGADVQVDVQVPAGLDRATLDMLLASVRQAGQRPAARRRPAGKTAGASRRAGRPQRSPDFTEAVRRMVAGGVARSTANARANAAESAGTLHALLAEYPPVRAVGDR
jgi:hypothetical protein